MFIFSNKVGVMKSTPYLFTSKQRGSIVKQRAPAPPTSRPAKPVPAPKPRLPMAKTLYCYEPQEADELTFVEGEMIEIIKEGLLFFIQPFLFTIR